MIITRLNIDKVDLDNLINQKIDSDKIEELLLVVPTNRKARTVKKEIISLMPAKSAHTINVETLGTLSSKLLKQFQPFRQLSEASSTVFIKQSAAELKLRYFSLYKNEIPFGTLDRLKNIFSEYKRHGISPKSLRDESEKLDKTEKLKTLDIADIFEKYVEKCSKLNAYELGDIYQKILTINDEDFYKYFFTIYSAVNLIIIDGFDEFTVLEQEIIKKLSLIDKIDLFINFDYNKKNIYLFSHLDKCFERFQSDGFNIIIDLSELRTTQFRQTIRDYLFTNLQNHKKLDCREKIFIHSAFNREKEVENISKEIKKIIIDKYVEPHKICVAFNLIQNYSSIVRDIFEKNGLPFNLSDRISLDNSNPVKAVINFLEIAENDFYYKNIFRALTSGFIETGEKELSNLHMVSSQLKIVSGKENWKTTITEALNNLAFDTEIEEDEQQRKIESYKQALETISQIEKKLQPFEVKLSIPEFSEKLLEFIYQSKIAEKILIDSDNLEENVRGMAAFIDTFKEVFDLLTDEYGSDKKFNLHFFLDQLRTACSWARFNVKEKSNYGVQITSLEEIRGLKFDYLFIGGLCDGDLPTRYSPEVFHSPSFRKKAFTHQTDERNLFYQALLTWKEKLFLSYPETEAGRELVKSSFLSEFEKLFEVNKKNNKDYQDIITSIEEFETELGKAELNFVDDELNRLSVKFNLNLQQISNSISIEKIREEDQFSVSPYTGFILSDEKTLLSEAAIAKLNSYLNRQHSITQLETYAKCPFKFFVEKVLNVQLIEEPTEDIEALEMGNILHNILYIFYTELRKQNIRLDTNDKNLISRCLKMINEIAEQKISQNAFKSPLTFYEKEKIFGIGGNKSESILSRFIEYEAENNNDYYPTYFEVRFGSIRDENSDDQLSNAEPIKIDGIKLKGKIDRIDLSKSDDSFSIVDYKLRGKKPTFRELKEGISLQLPVYLFAASELLKSKYNKKFSPDQMIIYSLKYSVDDFGKKPVSIRDKEIKTSEQLIQTTHNHIKKYIEQISRGQFGLSPHEEREQLVCRYCSFEGVCRIKN